jgi:hypothetical protein
VPAVCTSCVVASCCSVGDICDADSKCIQAMQCSAECAVGANTQTCYDNCDTTYGTTAATEAANLLLCVAQGCTSCP